MYRIRCAVYGGVTGHRESTLKREGKTVYFDNYDAAAAEATRLNRVMNGPNARATFSYTVEAG